MLQVEEWKRLVWTLLTVDIFPLYFGKDLQEGNLAAGWSCIITAVGNLVGIIRFL